jgi:hypothetical protein
MFLGFADRGREVDECSVSGGESDERVIYDEEVIAIKILLDGASPNSRKLRLSHWISISGCCVLYSGMPPSKGA